MRTGTVGGSAPAADAGQAGGARKLGRRLALWWSRTPDGRTYRRRRADAVVAAAGLGVLVVCGVLVASRTIVGTDVAVFRRINHWPGWLYPPMWTVQLSGVIGTLPLVAAAAALWRRLRLAAGIGFMASPRRQAAALTAAGARVVLIRPDRAAVRAIGRNVLDLSRRAAAARAGRAQAAAEAPAVRAVWQT